MVEDVFVIDGTVHAFNLDPANLRNPWDPHYRLLESLSGDDPRYLTSADKYNRRHDDGKALASALFAESQTDMACHHHVAAQYMAYESVSPMAVAKKAAEIAPGRMFFYGGASSVFDTSRTIDELERQVEEDGIVGVKFLAIDLYDGENKTLRMDDEKYVFPLLERFQKLGVTPAIDKNASYFRWSWGLEDLVNAAKAFPQMNFEIVHGGAAFTDEIICLAYLPNIYINVDVTASYMYRAPRRFADLLGHLMQDLGASGPAAEDRIVWASGCLSTHPQALLEKFWDFQIPEDMIEGLGYPQLTKEIKRKILGENWARLHGLDIETLKAGIPDDELRRKQLAGDLAEPWSGMEP